MTEGKLIIFSAPSGSGKTTLVHHILKKRTDIDFSISCTTRKKREKEQEGKDYYFMDKKTFKEKIKNGEFVEYEEVYDGIYYGTLKSELFRIWKMGKSVVFDMDVVGGLNLKKQFGDKALAIFVQPPSLSTLKNRLINRSTESLEKISMRMAKAKKEIIFAEKFDIILVNNELEKAKTKTEKIVADFIGD